MINKIIDTDDLLLSYQFVFILLSGFNWLQIDLHKLAGFAQIRQVFIGHCFHIELSAPLISQYWSFLVKSDDELPVNLSQDGVNIDWGKSKQIYTKQAKNQRFEMLVLYLIFVKRDFVQLFQVKNLSVDAKWRLNNDVDG